MRVVTIWIFFLTYSGVGHEAFSFGKLAGFVMIVLGVLFFNRILHLDFCFGQKKDEDSPIDKDEKKADDASDDVEKRGLLDTEGADASTKPDQESRGNRSLSS